MYNSTLKYSVPRESRVELYIHDISGKRIKTLFIGQRSSGSHIVSWDGKNNVGKHVSAGLYFYTLDTPSDRQTKKLILIK